LTTPVTRGAPATALDGAFVRYPLPWDWEVLEVEAFDEKLRQLARWVDWFVDRYHLARKVPTCWYLHPNLLDELKALWYYHQQVYCPLVRLATPEGRGEPEPPGVMASEYWHWHHERNLWIAGPLSAADGYRECLTKHQHVDDRHRADADDHAQASGAGLEAAIAQGLVAP
jgi:hypothetical protein